MLHPDVINGIRAVLERALTSGLVKLTEVSHLSRIVISLEAEERIWNERQAELKKREAGTLTE